MKRIVYAVRQNRKCVLELCDVWTGVFLGVTYNSCEAKLPLLSLEPLLRAKVDSMKPASVFIACRFVSFHHCFLHSWPGTTWRQSITILTDYTVRNMQPNFLTKFMCLVEEHTSLFKRRNSRSVGNELCYFT